MTDQSPRGPRPWDILELAAGFGSTDGALPSETMVARQIRLRREAEAKRQKAAEQKAAGTASAREGRTVRRVPTAAERMTALFRQADRNTRAIVRELARLGYDIADDVPAAAGDQADSRIYLTNVGRGRFLLVLTLAADGDTVRIPSVTFGRDTMQPTPAARWLKAREAR